MNKYDIFISYRRDGGKEWARMLSLELERLGYSVFLDFDELKDGIFDKRIMNAIESAPIFMVILSPHSLDRCVNEDDWVRREIEYAISHSRHFVPINPDCTFTGFPEDLPDGLKNGLGLHQFSEIMMGQLFKESVEKMVRYRIAPIVRVAGETAVQGNVDSLLKIETDLACRIFVDYENRGEAHPGKLTRLQLRGGSYRIRFVSLDNAADYVENVDFKIGHNTEEWYTVSLMPLKIQRERKALEGVKEKELKRKQRLALPDNRFKEYSIDGRKGFVDSVTGEILIPNRYDYVDNFSEGLAGVKKNRKYGFIDKTGKEVIPCSYDSVWNFSGGFAGVKKNGKRGFIDKLGKEVIPCSYDDVDYFREGLARVKKNGKWGFIDKTVKEVIPCSYDGVGNFSEGLAKVKKNGKWGFIDKSGKEVIPPLYSYASRFTGGHARVDKGLWTYYIDRKGKLVLLKTVRHFILSMFGWGYFQ